MTEVADAPAAAASGGVDAPLGPDGRPDGVHRPVWSTFGVPLLVPVVWAVVVTVGVVSLLRTGVAPGEIARFGVYWAVTILAPGYAIVRYIVDRRSLAENLVLGALTGLVLQQAAWHGLRFVGLDGLVTFWWLPVLAVAAAVPEWRRSWRRRHAEMLPTWWHVALALITALVFMAIDVGGFRPTPLPPADSTVYLDLWWHLAMVQELMRPGPAQIPQVVGENLTYHFNAHAHVAIGAQSANVEPEVVLFRLWYLPLVAVTFAAVAVVARRLSGSLVAGPLAAWLTGGALAGGFLWPNPLGDIASSPIVFLSPSQVIANVFMIAALGLAIDLVRDRAGRWHVVAFLATAWAGLGAKPTVALLLLVGIAGGALAHSVVRRRAPSVPLLVSGGGLLAMLAWSLASQNSSGSRVTVLGSLRGNRVYDEFVPSSGLRSINDGLLLESIDGPRAAAAAAIAVSVLLGFHAVRLVGMAVLFRSSTRRDPAGWMLASVVAAGWGAFLVLDHVGFSQAYFVHTAVPAGALMAAWLFADSLGTTSRSRATPVVLGAIGIGAVSASVAGGAGNTANSMRNAGMLVVAAAPWFVAAATGAGALIGWRWLRRHERVPPIGGAVAVALVVGMALTPAASAIAGRVVRYVHPGLPAVDRDAVSFVSEAEQHAARWLRDNSHQDDVVATNLHCRPPSNAPVRCDARYFVSGLSGRRIVLEGWAYTGAAQEQHGVDGVAFTFQPAPWPERYDLSQAAVTDPTPEVLERLASEYGALWVVAVRRADAIAPELFELADLAFDNGEVAIFRLR